MTINQATIAAQRQASISELEGKMKQVCLVADESGHKVQNNFDMIGLIFKV